ncbi:MAG: hypothetical protein AB1404_06915 [Spirochaetota bacterium]
MYRDRFYREGMGSGRFRSITISEGESDLWIGWNMHGSAKMADARADDIKVDDTRAAQYGADDIKVDDSGTDDSAAAELATELEQKSSELLKGIRRAIQDYGTTHPDFFTSLVPLPFDTESAEPVRSMLRAAWAAGVGPMAAVAGAIAEALGRALQDCFQFDELVIENGGDYWISVKEPLAVRVYGGLSSLSGKVSVIVPPALAPCGLACSSGTVGPSLSFGKADAALVLTRDAAAADAWATALGNRLRFQQDLAAEVEAIINLELPPLNGHGLEDDNSYTRTCKPLGALAIMADRLAACGAIQLG